MPCCHGITSTSDCSNAEPCTGSVPAEVAVHGEGVPPQHAASTPGTGLRGGR